MHEVFVKKRKELTHLKQEDVVLIRERPSTGSLNMQNTYFHFITTLLQCETKFDTHIKRHEI
jgi:hypothetical protein